MTLAGPLYGTSTVGLHLAQKVYEVGSTPSSAKERIDHVAGHINLCSTLFETLGQQLEEGPLKISDKAETLLKEINDLSLQTFDGIEDLLFQRKTGQAQTSNLLQTSGMPIKKARIDLFAGEIRYLRLTANLLLTVLCLARVAEPRSADPDLREGRKNDHADKALRQQMKAETALVEFIDAGDRLHQLEQQQSKGSPPPKTQSKAINKPGNSAQPNGALSLASQLGRIMGALTPSLRAATTQSQRPTSVLTESNTLLLDLLKEWTVPDVADGEEKKKKHWSAPLSPPHTPIPTLRESAPERSFSPAEGEKVSHDTNRDSGDSWSKGTHENIRSCCCHCAPKKNHIPDTSYEACSYNDGDRPITSGSSRARPAKCFHTLEELAELGAAFSESEKETRRSRSRVRERFAPHPDREVLEGSYLERDRGWAPRVRSNTAERSNTKFDKEIPERYYQRRDQQGPWVSHDDWDNPRLATRYPREDTRAHGFGDTLHIRTSNLGHQGWETRSASPRYANHEAGRESKLDTPSFDKNIAADKHSSWGWARRDTCAGGNCCHGHN